MQRNWEDLCYKGCVTPLNELDYRISGMKKFSKIVEKYVEEEEYYIKFIG